MEYFAATSAYEAHAISTTINAVIHFTFMSPITFPLVPEGSDFSEMGTTPIERSPIEYTIVLPLHYLNYLSKVYLCTLLSS